MKYPYLFGERTPARSAEEFNDLQYDEEMVDLRESFFSFLERFYPVTYDRFYRIWELNIVFMRWSHKQSRFVIGIVNGRSHALVGLYPTFKKAARALRAICNLDYLVDSPF